MNFAQVEELIKTSKKTLLIAHINPDGDALGSMCAMYSAIFDKFKKKSDMLIVGHLPNCYKFLPYINEAKYEFDSSLVYDLIITLDVAALDRLSNAKILFEKSKVKINIDHHKTNNNFGDLNFVNPKASSTGEILFGLFQEVNWKITLGTAIALYTSILTDTGGF